ncbi:dTDP-4-dehydrorhamnose 3,5-epimerase [Candidatus Pelagibacter bacterium]|jgi:dTDP-4-dehydrorhamnose 3,5-epimerase|nr:dTDP-4-dehydrorhamnose 3,5-epimerase [Candidatus Pelagibacter bacterium]
MIVKKTKFKGLLIIKQKNNTDKRGNLRETFNKKILKKKFVFEYCTTSKKNVFRGFHFQTKNKQSKFVNVVKGKILDVVIDLRKKSKTFGRVFSIVLSKKNALGLYIPAGFAHAYYSYSKENIIYYKLDNYYSPKFESGIIYNDKSLKIKLPRKMIVSKKDQSLMTIDQFKKTLKYL